MTDINNILQIHDTNLVHLEYDIVYDALQHKSLKKLPKNVRNRIGDIYYKTVHQPKSILPELEQLATRYPNVPVILNYLSAAYSRIGQSEKAEKVSLKNYKMHPNYLFSRINYAQICFNKKEYDKLPKIFNNKFELKLLHPERNKFHYSEFVSFNAIICRYFIATDQIVKAKATFNLLQTVAPKDAATKELKKILYPSGLRNLLIRLIERSMCIL